MARAEGTGTLAGRPGRTRLRLVGVAAPGGALSGGPGVTGVVPDRHAVRPGRRGVDVVAEELRDQRVRAAAPRVTRRAPVDRAERSGRPARAGAGLQHHT